MPSYQKRLTKVFFKYSQYLAYHVCSVCIAMYKPITLDPEAPFPHIYNELGWTSLEWIVTIGAVFALCTNMIGTLFPLPRILYSMASDGLLFKIFSKVDSNKKTPFWGTLLCGIFTAVLSSLFDLQQLMNMMSIGTLMAYTLVCLCVLTLRYTKDLSNSPLTTKRTKNTSVVIILAYLAVSILSCLAVSFTQNHKEPSTIMYTACGVSGSCLLLLFYLLLRQPQSTSRATFHVPLVPLVPCSSVVLNVYLMTQLDRSTWIRFTVWLCVGVFIYLFYGLRHSVERMNQRRALEDASYMNERGATTTTTSGRLE